MNSIIITSHFSKNGIPSINLSPTIRIWEVNSNNDLLIGSPDGIKLNTDGFMTEMISSSGTQDGFYKFEFTSILGFDDSKQYLIKVDGGSSETGFQRYQVSQIDPIIDVVDAIFNEPIVQHTQLGSFGEKINQISANTQQLTLNLIDVMALLDLILKYDTNRTKIDIVNHTLTVYDDDCSTPLRTFKLYDANGTPSVADVIERRPITVGTTDGQPVCN
jgi:hypothetical protein